MIPPADFSKVRTIELQARKNKVDLGKFARPPQPGRSVAEFVASLPRILAGSDFQQVVQAIVEAKKNNCPIIAGLGAHVIKCGLSPVIINLMERGLISGVALNGSGAIHDCEIALIGQTSEDVAAGLQDGTFGMVRETGELMNQAIKRVHQNPDAGLGSLLGEKLTEIQAPYPDYSILVAGRRLNIPVTVHVAIGTDIIHMHPSADGAAIGQATFNDFRLFTGIVSRMSGGVYLNVGSAVILPEVFLKAFTVAQNLGAGLNNFLTVNLDMIVHYRASENVVRRPPTVGGKGYYLVGRHELLVPLLAQTVVDNLERG